MRITKWGEYGVLCSLYLAHCFKNDNSAIGAAEIAEMQYIPLQYTQQILQRLRKGEIIESVRGPHGGYRLTRSPEEISMKDILTAAEGATFEVICEVAPIYESNCGSDSPCGLGQVWAELRSEIDSYLESKSLATILENHTIVNRSELQKNSATSGDQSCAVCCAGAPAEEEDSSLDSSRSNSDALEH